MSDQTTLQPTRTRVPTTARRVPTLCIAWHPDASRVGELLRVDGPVEIGRNSPEFAGRALDDPHVSRKPLRLTPEGLGIRVTPHPAGSPVILDGKRCENALIDPAHLARGATLGIAGRVVLVLYLGEVDPEPADPHLVGAGMDPVRRQIAQVADLDVSVLVRGETGTGKEHVARALHHQSRRRGRPFVAVNLAAIPASTAAAELFGHTRGAFTGADRARIGLFGQADGGTLFLDEVGEAPAEVQVVLLRVLETGELQRIGDDGSRSVDVRVIAATDADLEAAIAQGNFREPLLHRLSGFEIALPPLRERRQDVGPLIVHFLRSELDAIGELDRLELAGPAAEPWLPTSLASELIRADWSGNVRQLRNLVRQLVIASRGLERVIRTPAVDRVLKSPVPDSSPSRGVPDDAAIAEALREADYRPAAAAKSLGISKTTLYAWMARTPGVRKAGDLTPADLDGARSVVGEGTAQMARHLEVSKRGLTLRIKDLDWS